ncbi:methyltransferase domain-containing protein [Arthrobacter sp. I2-34]|uniref:Methyltransferase domain-containing protein n=2 Tax=Arthrobacter hankyongi TaxID=2904801 RepID=A0ABS9L654_9MICC|nr:methyltransferase domain-containing protein [Arthrobacter hankyongi]MCG2622115.1 methyltransferase domain-containing protein [Arthrobacter hankyongi]
MDRPDCDPSTLQRTYRQFALINRAVSGWRRTYLRQLRPRLAAAAAGAPDAEPRAATVLDIGCGAGDVARSLARWAAADGLPVEITAVDPDPRAYAYAASRPAVPGLTFRQAFSSELVAEGFRFDLVISNHILHHLAPAELHALLADSQALGRSLALHSDIARSRPAYLLFAAGTLPFFHRSYIRRDGLTSIRRSYTARELRRAVPPEWDVRQDSVFRLHLVFEPPGAGGA